MSNYEDDQSEDGEIAQSPVQDEMDFSLSDEDRDNADSLVIKPPQAVVKLSHRDRRAHKKSAKDRMKDPRKEKKHVHRDRDKMDKPKRDGKMPERDDAYREKQFYRDRDLYREKEFREKELKERESFRDRDPREKEMYRDVREKEAYRVREVQEKEMAREREMNRDRDLPRERDLYKEKEYSRPEREAYRDSALYREAPRQRDAYKEKDLRQGEKEMNRSREAYLARDMQSRYVEADRKYRKDPEQMRMEARTRFPAADINPTNNEKENRDKTTGDKELEDLRSRLLSKRIGIQSQSDKHSALDKHQEERRKKLLEAEREMEKRKQESRNELEARRQERRRRGKKRSHSPSESQDKKSKPSPVHENVVMISDASDVDMKSGSESENEGKEEGEHSKSESEDSSGSETESNVEDSKSEDDDDTDHEDTKEPDDDDIETPQVDERVSKPKSPANSGHDSGHSAVSHESKRSLSRSKSRSRSRSHSFSPPPIGVNGKTASDTPDETDELHQKRELQISALPPYFPALQGCRSVEEFQCLNRIEEGTYGVVYRARDKTTDEIVALKRLKMEKEKEGFPITSLREINTLLKGQHPNIVTCREIVVGSNMDKIFIVMDYVEHDLKSLMETMRNKKQVFLPGEVKCLMMQLLRAVHHLHDNWILHRDLKTSNLLLSHRGILKVGDFGLAREYGSPLRAYTPIVVTLWYRAPELLLCCKEYSTPIDIWSVGCIFAELVTMNALFPGKSEVDQLNRIFKDLGTPSESIWPGYNQLPAVTKMTFAEHPAGGMKQRIGSDLLSEMGHALLHGFLTYDPERRLTAEAAMEHAYFKEQPVAIDPSMFPTWPAKSEGSRRTAHSPRPPAGGAAYAQNARGDSDDSLGFRVHASRSINVAPGFSLKF